jgi:hypothetical protein
MAADLDWRAGDLCNCRYFLKIDFGKPSQATTLRRIIRFFAGLRGLLSY